MVEGVFILDQFNSLLPLNGRSAVVGGVIRKQATGEMTGLTGSNRKSH